MGRYAAVLMLLSVVGAAGIPAMAQSPPNSACDSVSRAAIAELAARGVSQALMSRILARIGDGPRGEQIGEWVNYVAAHQNEFARTPAAVMERWLSRERGPAEYALRFPSVDQANQCFEEYRNCLSNCVNLGNPQAELACVGICTLLVHSCYFLHSD